MNLSFTLEKASPSSPPAPPGPNTLVALEPAAVAAEEEAVVGLGAASASLRLSVMAGGQRSEVGGLGRGCRGKRGGGRGDRGETVRHSEGPG